MRVPRGCSLAAGVLFATGMFAAASPASAAAQRPDTVLTGRRPAPRPDTVLTGAGRRVAPTPRRAAAADSAQQRQLVTWADSDSVVTALLERPGYQTTRYQGDTVRFDAAARILRIVGEPAAVGRGTTLVVGDTVIYNDAARVVTALGDTVVLRDPSQQAADVVARGRVTYDVTRGRGAVTNVQTSLTAGEEYFVYGREAVFVRDTTPRGRTAYYVQNGIITSCSDSIPDYYFRSNQIKYVTKNLIVARPATLYVGGVPVFWLPFLFQDVRSGRRSGFLTPRFGLSEFVRSSPSYRRHIENLGYYLNLGDYMDAEAWLDWRSSARGTAFDPGFTRTNGQFRYRWLDRFMTGGISASRDNQANGQTNTAVSWTHSQEFSQTSRLSMNINFVTNTTVQRRTTFNPIAQLATIRSDVRYGRKVGPFSLDVGGSRSQYPGRPLVEENYPNISLSSQSIGIGRSLSWTPNLSYSRTGTRNSDQLGQTLFRYLTSPGGALDSSRVRGSTSREQLTLQTPFVIRGFTLNLSATGNSDQRNYPMPVTFVDPADTSRRITRTYANFFTQSADWQFGFGLPTLFPGTLRLSPAVTFNNVYGGAYFVRSTLSGAQWVRQSKRPTFSLGVSPTVFGLFPGVGPFARIRHSVTPTVTFGFAPRGNVDPAYLRALNQNPATFLGALEQRQVTLALSQVFEAKLRSDTGASGAGRKIKLMSLNFDPLTWDFVRARRTGRTGLTSNSWGYNFTSDLLPGFTFRSGYSLFQGDIQSDTARFQPFLTDVQASFTLNGQSGVLAVLNRIFRRATRADFTGVDTPVGTQPSDDEALTRQMTSLPVAGTVRRDQQFQIPATPGGFSSNISFALNRQRPPRGGTVLTYDPAAYCSQYTGNPVLFDTCRTQATLNPLIAAPATSPVAGGVFVRVPPRAMVTATNAFKITQFWSANWTTQYDMVNSRFASNMVTLQRDLHDWRAVFSFSQSPNGNFYFTFFIANKAQPDLKFNYSRPTYRQSGLR